MQNYICEISSQTIEKDRKGFTCEKCCGSIYIYPPVNMLLPHVDIDLYPFRNTQFKTFYHVTLQLAIITRHVVSGKVVGPFLAAVSINSPSGCCPVRLTKTDAR